MAMMAGSSHLFTVPQNLSMCFLWTALLSQEAVTITTYRNMDTEAHSWHCSEVVGAESKGRQPGFRTSLPLPVSVCGIRLFWRGGSVVTKLMDGQDGWNSG